MKMWICPQKQLAKSRGDLVEARVANFEAQMNRDVLLLKRAMEGHRVLQDKLGWIQHQKRVQQVDVLNAL